MLRTLVLDDMTFGVFPFMETGFTYPWYHNIGEVFDAVLQVLQVRDERSVFDVLC
jgi:hypothetical protein